MKSTDFTLQQLTPEAELPQPELQRLLQDWLAAARVTSDGVPGFDFADPLRLRYLLGSLVLLDVAYDAMGDRAYRYRLIGTDIVSRRGKDYTGRFLHQHDEEVFAHAAIDACGLAVDERRPVYATLRRQIGKGFYRVQYLTLPLAGPSGGIERLMTAQIYPAEAPSRPYGMRNQGLPYAPSSCTKLAS
ncbi:hypothetical protein [Ferrovibrio sp.]|uniref:hypothetical protein n=1 Tax=Ferrovibrio sp. TaxID=1917215 RepID=UPI003D2B6EF4